MAEDPKCVECGFTAPVALAIVMPYSFGKGAKNIRWLCAPYSGRQCRDMRYAKYREWLKSNEPT